ELLALVASGSGALLSCGSLTCESLICGFFFGRLLRMRDWIGAPYTRLPELECGAKELAFECAAMAVLSGFVAQTEWPRSTDGAALEVAAASNASAQNTATLMVVSSATSVRGMRRG